MKKKIESTDGSYELRVLEAEYQKRFTYLKSARSAFDQKNHEAAFANFSKFLKIMSDVNDCDLFDIQPNHFDGPTKMAEMLVLSHVYLEMAKYYSLSPKFENELKKALDQFVKFTVNEPYQVVNSETLRKHLKHSHIKHGAHHFDQALRTIYIKSKKCFIATFTLGENHAITQQLRSFKKILSKKPIGMWLIVQYYHLSPKLLFFIDKRPRIMANIFRILSKLILVLFSKILTSVNIRYESHQ